MFLLDANVVSEIRKVASGRADAGVAEWSRTVDAELLTMREDGTYAKIKQKWFGEDEAAKG